MSAPAERRRRDAAALAAAGTRTGRSARRVRASAAGKRRRGTAGVEAVSGRGRLAARVGRDQATTRGEVPATQDTAASQRDGGPPRGPARSGTQAPAG